MVDPRERDAFLARAGAAAVYEASGVDCACDPGITPVWPGARVVGPAFPLTCQPADNLALHRALAEAPAGSVLVAQAGGVLAGYWGEVMAVAAQCRRIAGLVIDGGVRDVDEMQQLGFPAFARGIAVHRTAKSAAGQIGSPVVVGGVLVRAGDLVVADSCGVVVLPAEMVDATVLRVEKRLETEKKYMTGLRAGELTLDLMGLRDRVGLV